MKNDLKDIKGLFVVDNKEATVEAIKKIKSVIIYTHGQIKQLHGHEIKDEKNITTLCTAIINNFFWLVNTLDKSKKSQLTKDLDYLYKHCLFSVIRVRDFKDYDFLPGCVQILEEITEGWDRVTFAADKASAFG
jgi:flagellin-specific chaperone FliS|tara:strand:+ start:95 stop:496 length:402 start_codon:yes stop_codon:yes gene_type:complete